MNFYIKKYANTIMDRRYLPMLVMITTILWGCAGEQKTKSAATDTSEEELAVFDREKWLVRDGEEYPYRAQMLNAVVYNDTIRDLNQEQILELLGEPDYIREGHFYYRITETSLALKTLHTRTMVIKFVDENTIEWIKIHE